MSIQVNEFSQSRRVEHNQQTADQETEVVDEDEGSAASACRSGGEISEHAGSEDSDQDRQMLRLLQTQMFGMRDSQPRRDIERLTFQRHLPCMEEYSLPFSILAH